MEPSFVLDPLPVWIAAVWLAVLMLHAAWSKSRDRLLWLQHLAAYRVPDKSLTVLGVLMPLAEGVSGLLVLTGWRTWGAAACACLLLIYAGVMAWHLQAGRQLDCGCGGEPMPLSWALVARNAGLLLVCAVASTPTTDRVLHWTDVTVMVAAVLLGLLVWAMFHQVLRHARRASAV